MSFADMAAGKKEYLEARSGREGPIRNQYDKNSRNRRGFLVSLLSFSDSFVPAVHHLIFL